MIANMEGMTTMNDTSCELFALAWQTAEQLGDGWHVTSSSHSEVELAHPSGFRLTLRQGPRDRIVVRGQFPPNPHGLPQSISPPEITAAPNCSASNLASSVRRRLLPIYAATLARIQVCWAERAREEACRHQLAEQIRALLPGARRSWRQGTGWQATELQWHGDVGVATFTFTGDATAVDLHLKGVPRSLAVQVCCLLAEEQHRRTTEGRNIA